MNRCLVLLLACTAVLAAPRIVSQTKFYHYYSAGQEFLEKKDWLRAIGEFQSAVSLEFEDAGRKRTYGTHFIEYYPHRDMGYAHLQLKEYAAARKELELSAAYDETDDVAGYLDEITAATGRDTEPAVEPAPPPAAATPFRGGIIAPSYDPSAVTQVGSRLAVAVIPFEAKGEGKAFADAVTETMITKLVNLRRFKVIERSAIDNVMKEQQFQASGIVDEKTAVRLGRIAGADAIIVGSILITTGTGKFSARVIDVETAETIVAEEQPVDTPIMNVVAQVVGNVATMIHNDLPLAEGIIVRIDADELYINIGSSQGVRKGTKCVVFREGDPIHHPVTGEVLGRKVTRLGELLVVQVQDRLACMKTLETEQAFKVGDKVVLK